MRRFHTVSTHCAIPHSPRFALTIFVHADFLAFLESARATLVAMRFVNQTIPLTAILADVLPTATDGSLEETRASAEGATKEKEKVKVRRF